MEHSRRQMLTISFGALGLTAKPLAALVAAQTSVSEPPRRISSIIHEYEEQGFHRTATAVDQVSADWLSQQVQQAGLAATQEPFQISRVDPVTSVLVAGDHRVEGLPLFDGPFTDARGVQGRLGPLASDAQIGIIEIAPGGPFTELSAARRANRHRAIVCITKGDRPGLCALNADSFLQPFGPPVLQLSSAEAPRLNELSQRGAEVQLVVHAMRTPARAVNVTTEIRGTDPVLPPLVVMTPRSGWYRCASERGGGLACWLEVMRALVRTRPTRTVLFVASSGHELGHLGLKEFVSRRPGIVSNAAAWMHFGANIGAAIDPGNRLQASGDDMDALLTREMTRQQLAADVRVPRGTAPGGEAAVIHRGGGRYVSIIGFNALFHNPQDRGREVIDPDVIARFCTAFTALAAQLASA